MNIKKLLFLLSLLICFGVHSKGFTQDSAKEFILDVPVLDNQENKSGIDNFLALEFSVAISPRNFSSGLTDRTKDKSIDFSGFQNDYTLFQIRHTEFDLAYLKIAKLISLSFPNFLIAFPHYYFT